MDVNPGHLVTASLLADSFVQVPPSGSPEFEQELLKIIRHQDVDTYLPLIDKEIETAARLRAESRIPTNIQVLAPGLEAAVVCLDKFRTAQWLEENSLPTPLTVLASADIRPLGKRFFLKPREGFGSKGARMATPEAVEAMDASDRQRWVAQALCYGPEVTVDAFFDPDRNLTRTVCRERVETKSGVCTKARLFFDKCLDEIAATISSRLPLFGTFCFQAMRYHDRWCVIDINARPGGGTAMSAASGIDFFGAAFARAWGIDPRPAIPALQRPVFVTRQYSEYVMSELACQ